MVRVPLRSSIMFTSNGATFQNSMARRMVMIQQDAALRKTKEKDGKKVYTVPDIKNYVRNKKNRAHIVRCILILVKGWLQAGRPQDKEVKEMPSFESWSATVPSIVKYAGWASMHPAMHAASNDANADRKEAEQFIHAWWERYEEQPIRASQLGELAVEGGFYVPRMKISSKTANPAYVGRSINARWMGFIKRWPVTLTGGLKVQAEEGPKDSGQPTWHLRVMALDHEPMVVEEDETAADPSFDSEYLDGFDPDGVDPFSPA
jgi:hypothetical protein